jgi:hypothetical protein
MFHKNSVLVEGRVLVDEVLLVLRHIVKGMNRIGGAYGNAGAAIDAAFGIHIHLGSGFETGLILLGMDAVGRAYIDTEGILNARIGNYISHDESISRMK